uniref:Cytochrome c biogenesis protein CcsA n=1 Tax=Rhizochromulina marina TaxID=1034831 RepID=A0A514CQ46_9STRA|nr:cytochrome c biogenesis protein [Rhizochromulina marina]QDH81894.1 cytochrome c biogenesis protein [Rhizochromulina marina]
MANASFLVLFYTTVAYWLSIKYQRLTILKNLCWIGVVSSNLFLFLLLFSRWILASYFPLSNLYESLLFLDWCLLFILLFIETKTQTKLMGAIILPIILLIITFASLVLPPVMQESSPLVPALQSNWLMMHVSMMMLSYATLIIGSLLSILFLVLSLSKIPALTRVDAKSLGLPSFSSNLLSNIDNWSYRIIGLGFPFLTVGIIAGAVWANEAWGSYWSWDPKETWALITWLVFASYIHARLTKGLRGTQAAALGSLGFIVVWICYLGVNFWVKVYIVMVFFLN